MEQLKILITGANGLIGNALYECLSKNNTVVAVDNNFRKGNVVNDTIIDEDLIEFYKKNQNDFDFIFHLAAINGTDNFYDVPNTVLKNNIEIDLATFNFASQNSNCKIIYSSSSEVISGTQNVPTPEETDIYIENIHNPRWSYRISKIVGENYLANSNLNFLVVRFFNVFSKDSRPGHFVYDIIEKIKEENFDLIGADETRSFCYIDDAIDTLIYLANTVSNEFINIGNDEEITVLDAADIIAKEIYNKKISWVYQKGKIGSTKRRCPSLNKLKQFYTNYCPTKFINAVRKIYHEIHR
jgi:nucleoside-diphosphate-sugar epimerase